MNSPGTILTISPGVLPILRFSPEFEATLKKYPEGDFDDFIIPLKHSDFNLYAYEPQGPIKGELSTGLKK
jgi:hypothetical protein